MQTRHNLIFDFGNVLVRWEPQRVYLPYFGGDETQYWYFWRHVCNPELRNRIDAGEDQQQCINSQKALFPDYAAPLEMFITDWEETLPGEMPGMRELLLQLKADPRYRIFGLTNWSMETFPLARKKFEILQMIDNYVVSGDVKLVKPDPAIFRLALDRFGIRADETTFIDDNPDNVEAAKQLGMDGIVFTNAASLRAELL